ncbi:sirohydrochlorin chelatase [Natranaerobius thermophilus]|uniref:Cobalamin (Vitamin B12) biosynthesis CbiX protein n=1 Tax=Natranaerobius thermophilus (strain ATCC BAA-1301 / DSM 18059 / JW/NM-WN-LF) TaxID=457570 RepID=B2A0F2_NATTJ|nr:CbiX/SirB N-terminal domain-containing protein [Natranaerobius thermophilus]ACB84513.1 cobalamin (vitamin B12) biosynthesis CbiX protein [Natranaerobius thermophilus JW/NM-WN-LF]
MEINIILGHGSRNPEANEVLKTLATMYRENNHTDTSYAFLQFASPTLEEVLEDAISKKYQTIVIAPVFLYPGVHIKKDIPEKLEKYRRENPEKTFILANPIGEDPRLIKIIENRIASAKGSQKND